MSVRSDERSQRHSAELLVHEDDQLWLLLTISFLVGASGLSFALKPTVVGFAVFNASNANATAIANITIVANVAITVTGGWDFGEGFVNSSGGGAYASLQSGASGDDPYNYTNWTANINGTGQVTVRNSGAINISVRANANQSADRWFCNDEYHQLGATHLNNYSLNTTGGTDGGTCVTTFIPLTNISDVDILNGTMLCDNGNLTTQESIVVDMAIRIDQRCPTTLVNRYITVMFFGYS